MQPDSIAEINILKDANAVKLFGTDAKDGAIVITTKSERNKTGQLNLKFKNYLPADGKNLKTFIYPDAIYILNGQKTDKDIVNLINPNSIASVSILEKNTAIAQYGPAAAAGVIIVTTKNSKNISNPNPSEVKTSLN